jgi:hypothetical protein
MTTNETLDVPTDLPTTIQLEPATPPDEFTAPAQPAGGAEGPAAPQAERTVEIRKGVPVPVRVLLAHYNPNCGLCNNGWDKVPRMVNGVAYPQICACTVVRYERAERESKRLKQEVHEAVATPSVARAPHADQVERAERRVGRLTREVEAMDRDMHERERGFAESVLGLDTELSAHASRGCQLNGEVTGLELQVQNDETALAEAEEALKRLREQVADSRAKLAQATEAMGITAAFIHDLDTERKRRRKEFEHKTRRLRRDLDRARGQLASAQEAIGLLGVAPTPAAATESQPTG